MEIKMEETEMKNLNENRNQQEVRSQPTQDLVKEWLSRIKTISQVLLLIILVGMLVSSTLFLRQPLQKNEEIVQLLYKVLEMPSPIVFRSFPQENGNGSSNPRIIFKD